MTNRVAIGNLGSAYGLKISKPGYDVLSTAAENLLLDSTSGNFGRIVTRGTFVFPSGGASTQTTSIPTLGVTSPWVEFRRLQVYNGKNYAYTLAEQMNGTNSTSFSCSATEGLITVAKNITIPVTLYIGYFVLAQPGGS